MHCYEGKNEVPQKTEGEEIKSRNGRLVSDRNRDILSIASHGQAKSVDTDVLWIWSRKMRNSVWYLYFFFCNELWEICQDWWGEKGHIGDWEKKIEDIVWTEHLKALIWVLNCAVCPTEICVCFKVKTANMVGYMFFYKHMKSLGDLVQA